MNKAGAGVMPPPLLILKQIAHVGWVKRPLLRIPALAVFVHPAQQSGPIKSMILLGSPLTRLNPTYTLSWLVEKVTGCV